MVRKMIQYLQSQSDGEPLKIIKTLQPNSWVRVEKPTPDEITELIKTFDLDEVFIENALDPHEIPRIESEDGIIYFITRLPDTDDDFNDFTTPIMFIVHREHLISISRDSLARLWQPFIAKTELNTSFKAQALVTMLSAIVTEYQHKVAAINRQTRSATIDITRLRPADIATFVEYERKLNDYLDALIPSNDALEELLGSKFLKLKEDDRNSAEEISVSFEQIIARCKSLLRTITNVRDSYSAVINARLNETIRLLTVITLALTIPTMLAGLFGMNVELPGNEQSSATFWIIAAISLGTSATMAFYFLYKRR